MSLIKRPDTLKMAPPGSHVVKGHMRISENGVKHFVKVHTRKNRGKKATLLPENLLFLFWHGDRDFSPIGQVKGFAEFPELDSVIQFWLEFWKEQGLPFPDELDPFLVKIIIAVESSFRPKVRTKVSGSSATGLMQLVQSTLNRLEGIPVEKHIEVKDHFLQLKLTDLTDPVINIAAGIRWLSHKYWLLSIDKRVKDKGVFSTIKYYHSWDIDGEKYANKIFEIYKSSSPARLLPIR